MTMPFDEFLVRWHRRLAKVQEADAKVLEEHLWGPPKDLLEQLRASSWLEPEADTPLEVQVKP